MRGSLSGTSGRICSAPTGTRVAPLSNLVNHPDAQLGLALLDQTLVAGLGNLYRCELCFLHGVSPWTAMRDVPEVPSLVERAHLLISANRDRARAEHHRRPTPA